jgi:RNA polymerase sigma-70 factor (ECF subfamily)
MQTPRSDTQILLKNPSKGDSTIFWELWLLHQGYLYHCCLKWMDRDVTDAQDALSQTMLKAWDKLPLYAEKITNLKAWLTRFSHNLCMDIHREHGRKEIGIDDLDHLESPTALTGASSSETPDARVSIRRG